MAFTIGMLCVCSLAAAVSKYPHSKRSDGSEIDRRYFECAKDAAMSLVKKGDTRQAVENACEGKEYPPFETIRGEYFAVAIDSDRSRFFNVPNFRPQPVDPVDFFFSGKSALVVFYDKSEVVVGVAYYGPRPSVIPQPNKSLQSTPTAVMPPAEQAARQP